MKVLDLFACQGGASAGYALAGATVRGIDNNPSHATGYARMMERHPSVEFGRHDQDWLAGLNDHAQWSDFIHASPPCQGYSVMQRGTYGHSKQEKLINTVRDALNATGKPWVIENVGGARSYMRDPLILVGSMFRLGAEIVVENVRPWSTDRPYSAGARAHRIHCLNRQYKFSARIHRARLFEFGNMPSLPLAPERDREWERGRVNMSIVNGSTTDDWHRLGHRDLTLSERGALLAVDWGMSKLGYAEAIPPAYTEFIAKSVAPLIV